MNWTEAEQLVEAGRARWFLDPEVAEAFARESGGHYAGEIQRISRYRYLVVLAA
jgi:hypothetical protein